MTAEFYPDYPDPLPAFQYIGGDYGRGLLESALAAPQHTAGGMYLARTVFDKTALLFRWLVKNHAMVDGNKRLALTTATVFLYVNGYVLTAATKMQSNSRWGLRQGLRIQMSSLSPSGSGGTPSGSRDCSRLLHGNGESWPTPCAYPSPSSLSRSTS